MDNKTLGIIAGTAISSFIFGGVTYKICANLTCCKTEDEKEKNKSNNDPRMTSEDFVLRKSYSHLTPISEYIINNSLREPEVLRQLKEHTFQNVRMSRMLSDPAEAQLFRVILKAINARKCLEVGTYTGYNALSMALALPSGGKVFALDINDEYVNHGVPFFKSANVDHKIKIEIAPAGDTMDRLVNEGHAGTFDFIYVDADKPGYATYFEKGLQLLRSGGLFAFDNTLQSGRVVNTDAEMSDDNRVDAKAMDAFNKKIHLDSRVVISFLNIADGVTFCCKI